MPHRQVKPINNGKIKAGFAPLSLLSSPPLGGAKHRGPAQQPNGLPPAKLGAAVLCVIGVVAVAAFVGQRAMYNDGLYVVPIPRVANLTYSDFYHKYAKKARPVIIENYTLVTRRWTLEYLDSVCGNVNVDLQIRNAKSKKWAKLEYSRSMKLREYLNYFRKQSENPTDKNPLYMFDWGIGKFCPQLAQDLIVPKYFAGDYFKRTPGDSGRVVERAMNNWPSLFLGNAAAASALHIDFANTAFWMGMLEGRKKWYVLPRKDADNIYRHEGTNAFEVDLMAMQESGKVDYKRYPKLRKITVMEAVLGPNEVLFVPAGCPHQVKNLDDTIAIAGNFVDESNFELFLKGFRHHTTQHGMQPSERDLRVEAHFKGEEFAKMRGMDSLQEDTPWSVYNSWPKPAFKGARLR